MEIIYDTDIIKIEKKTTTNYADTNRDLHICNIKKNDIQTHMRNCCKIALALLTRTFV